MYVFFMLMKQKIKLSALEGVKTNPGDARGF